VALLSGILRCIVHVGSITLAPWRTVPKHDEGAFLRHRGASYRFQLTLFKASVALAHHGCGAPGQYGLPGVTVFRCDCVPGVTVFRCGWVLDVGGLCRVVHM